MTPFMSQYTNNLLDPKKIYYWLDENSCWQKLITFPEDNINAVETLYIEDEDLDIQTLKKKIINTNEVYYLHNDNNETTASYIPIQFNIESLAITKDGKTNEDIQRLINNNEPIFGLSTSGKYYLITYPVVSNRAAYYIVNLTDENIENENYYEKVNTYKYFTYNTTGSVNNVLNIKQWAIENIDILILQGKFQDRLTGQSILNENTLFDTSSTNLALKN
jgi:hypothetical protein